MSRKTWKLVSLLVVVLTMAVMVVPAFAQEEVSPTPVNGAASPRATYYECTRPGDQYVSSQTHTGSCLYEFYNSSYVYRNVDGAPIWNIYYLSHRCVTRHSSCGAPRIINCPYPAKT